MKIILDEYDRRIERLEYLAIEEDLQKKLTPYGLEIRNSALGRLYELNIEIDGQFDVFAGDKKLFSGDTQEVMTRLKGYGEFSNK